MNITIYCGANLGTNPIHQADTIAVGKWIAENEHTLVYGGGATGLMGLVADTVLAHGGKAIGVMPTFLLDREPKHPKLTEFVEVETMAQRKQQLLDLGDACIALAGGAGTLEEISEVISWARIGKNPNPCILFNSDGFYEPLRQCFDMMVSSGFLSAEDRSKTLFSHDLVEIEQFIRDYTPPRIRTYEA